MGSLAARQQQCSGAARNASHGGGEALTRILRFSSSVSGSRVRSSSAMLGMSLLREASSSLLALRLPWVSLSVTMRASLYSR
eukprot:scaffold5075_cov296-Prasinococcus_capsulatus_cf.AAC.3